MKDEEAWCAIVPGLQRVRHDLVTEHQQLKWPLVAQMVKNLPAMQETQEIWV